MWVEFKVTLKGSMGGQWCTKVFQLLNKENFNINPLYWRDEGLRSHFTVSIHYANGQCKGTCMYSIVHLLALASLIVGA